MRPGDSPRSPVAWLCLWALLPLAAPGCGENPKAASVGVQKALDQREKSLRERQTKQAPAKPRR